jgi:hypothetical protein
MKREKKIEKRLKKADFAFRIKKELSLKNIKNFLNPRKINIALFVIIIAIHYGLNLGLGFFPINYNFFVSLLYGAFSLPLSLLDCTNLWSLNVISTQSFIALLLPLVLHLIYWYIVASFVGAVVRQKNKTVRYRNAFILLAVFFAFFIICYFFLLFFDGPFLC